MIWLLLGWFGASFCLALVVVRRLRDSRPDVEAQGDSPAKPAIPETQDLRAPESCSLHEENPGVHHFLAELNRLDPRLAKTVLLRWIGGLSRPTIAATLGVTVDLVEHDLQLAKMLLRSKCPCVTPPPGRN